jgi:lipopolysaccharide transport system permease protein
MSHTRRVIIIQPRTGWSPINFGELWAHRELALMLAWREILLRYKQSLLGIAWAVLQPLSTMLIFTGLFTIMLGEKRMPTPDGVPYAVSTFCALLPWQLFAQSVSRASISIVNNQSLVSKVYFPRMIVPLAPVLAALLDFAIAFAVLLLMMLFTGVKPSMAIFTLPLFIALALASALAAALFLAALNTVYRDIQHVVPFLIQMMMYATPVLYTAETILRDSSSTMRWLYFLNPMAGVAEGFRWALLGTATPDLSALATSAMTVGMALIASMYYFKRIERQFADVV